MKSNQFDRSKIPNQRRSSNCISIFLNDFQLSVKLGGGKDHSEDRSKNCPNIQMRLSEQTGTFCKALQYHLVFLFTFSMSVSTGAQTWKNWHELQEVLWDLVFVKMGKFAIHIWKIWEANSHFFICYVSYISPTFSHIVY